VNLVFGGGGCSFCCRYVGLENFATSFFAKEKRTSLVGQLGFGY
jgi:hypothetical protein